MQPFGQKLQITRPAIASQPAFDRHFANLLDSYPLVHIVNLLGGKDQEALLTHAYEAHVKQASADNERFADHLAMSNFDFHARARAGGIETMREQIKREGHIMKAVGAFGYCIVSLEGEKQTPVTSECLVPSTAFIL